VISDLISTVLSLHTIQFSFSTLLTAFSQVCEYVARFRARLSPTNLVHLKHLVVFLDALKKILQEWKDKAVASELSSEVISVSQLNELLGRKVTGLNLLEIRQYLKQSRVS
jgi:chromosome transmission fidelity protein 1